MSNLSTLLHYIKIRNRISSELSSSLALLKIFELIMLHAAVLSADMPFSVRPNLAEAYLVDPHLVAILS